jgi:hypothetical protein
VVSAVENQEDNSAAVADRFDWQALFGKAKASGCMWPIEAAGTRCRKGVSHAGQKIR